MLSREILKNDALCSRLFIQFDEISIFCYACVYADTLQGFELSILGRD